MTIVIVASDPGMAAAWIQAGATLLVGGAAVAFTYLQWRSDGFRPKYDAFIGQSRTRLIVLVRNAGRAGGAVRAVGVTETMSHGRARPVEVALVEDNKPAGAVESPTASILAVLQAGGAVSFVLRRPRGAGEQEGDAFPSRISVTIWTAGRLEGEPVDVIDQPVEYDTAVTQLAAAGPQ